MCRYVASFVMGAGKMIVEVLKWMFLVATKHFLENVL
jgi:hypothetical protein